MSNHDEAIEIINPETIDAEMYAGTVVKTHPGYAFLSSIKRGYETISTNGDVFAVLPADSQAKLGDMVQFRFLEPDPERIGKFRTDTVASILCAGEMLPQDRKIYDIALLSKTESPYHLQKKQISGEDYEVAKDNRPFENFISQMDQMLHLSTGFNPDFLKKRVEEFILANFPELEPMNVRYAIDGTVDENSEEEEIRNTIESYKDMQLDGQAESLESQYKSFRKVRTIFNFMLNEDMLRWDTIIPRSFLPELTFAMPVWFMHTKNGVRDQTMEDDPHVSEDIKRIIDYVGSKEYAWFFQMYNRRTRPLSLFKGKDIIPPKIARLIPKAKEIFDSLAIITPYHDIASREWSDSNWLRNIDPVLIGFIHELPYIFVLGRWSGTGLFPLMIDMMADTANHIKINKSSLSNFIQSTYWYKGDNGECLASSSPHRLPIFADALLGAYSDGKVFEFMRGEFKNDFS